MTDLASVERTRQTSTTNANQTGTELPAYELSLRTNIERQDGVPHGYSVQREQLGIRIFGGHLFEL